MAILFFSFDTDTGLKQALATVNDYNPLMKDFPINDLLSATELDRIRTSVQVSRFFHACGTVSIHYM
jgi:dynein heavy chain 1